MAGIGRRQKDEAGDFSRSRRPRRRLSAIWLAPLACLVACAPLGRAQAQSDGPGFDRPGLGYSPQVLPAGGFAWEQGLPSWSRWGEDDQRFTQTSTDTLWRLGLGHALELQLGSAPFNRLRQTGEAGEQHWEGHGDASVGLKWQLPVDSERWQWAMLGSAQFNDGVREIADDRRRYALAIDAQQQLSAQASLGYYAQWQRSGGHSDSTVAVNYNHSIGQQWAAYVEAGWLHQQDLGGSGSVAGAGLTWQPTPRWQLDGYARHHLSGHTREWEAGLGVSLYLGPLPQ